ncbi:TetR/AcrR family transcriptional regulator [Amycolatopsis sp. cmx-4-68]|uniref:TetR/AcrR family transcriptional regulator n=1 Tax=Amycolatopsis sp. cmx-4-68 TaxID=2790938 RepID=UPI00397BAF05
MDSYPTTRSSLSPDRPPATLRADAERNRRRILEAAREVFLESGLDVPMSKVIRRSGVGAATLYRRFPTRTDLITEVFTEQVSEGVRVVMDAAADPDPWRGFCAMIENLCALDAITRGFIRAFLSTYPQRGNFEAERQRAEHVFADLIRRAKQSGQLRSDFQRSDFDLVLLANGGLEHADRDIRLAASRRFATLLRRAFRASPEEGAGG